MISYVPVPLVAQSGLDLAYFLRRARAQVGLPARGKSYMVKKLSRYLTWLGYETNVFNVGEARRKTPGFEIADHSFFSSGDADARRMREQIAFSVLDVCLT